MNKNELRAKLAVLQLLHEEKLAAKNHTVAAAIADIASDLSRIYSGMPIIQFAYVGTTGGVDLFDVDDHHECVEVVTITNDGTTADAGVRFSAWLKQINA